MSLLYPDTIRYGSIYLSTFAELLAGNNTAPLFNRTLGELFAYYPFESDKLLNANIEDHKASSLALDEARRYCMNHDLAIPAKLKISENPEELKLRVLALEQELAALYTRLKVAEDSKSEQEPVSALRALGALAMLLANKPKYQDTRSKDINPALAPIGDAVVAMIENDLRKDSKSFASKTMQAVIKQGVLAFNTKLQDNDDK